MVRSSCRHGEPMSHYVIDPEVAGQLGPETILIRGAGKRPQVEFLEYTFDGWLGDDLLQSHPCFIVTQRLADAIFASELTGYRFDRVKVSRSGEFMDMHPNKQLPDFVWLQIIGKAFTDDFGFADDNRLLVSKKALDVLKQFNLDHCETEAT